MSNKKRVNRKRRRSPWYKMFAGKETRLSARVTSEEDWQTDVPNIRLSRAFVIVLLMHLVVGGALVAFTLMNPNDAKAAAGQAKQRPAKVAVNKSQSKAKSPGSNPVAKSDRMDDMRRHIVHNGDSVAKIASQYGVSSEEIHAVNRIDELYQLYQGRVLRIPVSASSPVKLNSRIAEKKSSTNGSNFVRTEQSRTQVSVPRAEIATAAEKEAAETEATAEKEPLTELQVPELSRPVVVEETAPAPTPKVVKQTPAAPPVVKKEPSIVRPRDVPAKPYVAPVAKKLPAKQKTYTVVKGDNPFRIAQRFGINYKDLLRHNGISDPSKLQIGQRLNIPN